MAFGQAASEFIVLMGISLLIITIFLIIATQSTYDISSQKGIDEAKETVTLLAQSADSVYTQGEGASRLVFVSIPRTANLNRSYIGRPQGDASSASKTINLNVGGTAESGGSDIFATTSATVFGTFLPLPGAYQMRVLSRGSYVIANPALVDLLTPSISVSMAQGETREVSIRLKSVQNESISVSLAHSWGFSNVSLSIEPKSLEASSSGSQFDININSIEGTGAFNSNIVLNAVGAESNISESFDIPLSVVVLG